MGIAGLGLRLFLLIQTPPVFFTWCLWGCAGGASLGFFLPDFLGSPVRFSPRPWHSKAPFSKLRRNLGSSMVHCTSFFPLFYFTSEPLLAAFPVGETGSWQMGLPVLSRC